jgi:uncharacterized membrane protein
LRFLELRSRTVLDSLFSFFFKYRPLLFREGEIQFGAPVPSGVLLGLGLAVLAAGVWTYARQSGRARGRDRLVLGSLRAAAVAVVLVCLFRPTLVVSSVVPQQNWLAVLIDDSRSMRIADDNGPVRAARVQATLGDESAAVLRSLAARFQLRFYRFGEHAEPVAAVRDLGFADRATRIGPALDRVRADLGSVPLSGIVLVSDGADSPGAALAESLLALRAAELPVYTVGVGREAPDRDVEVLRVASPRSALRGSALIVDVTIAHRGFAGRTVPLHVEDAGRLVAVQDVTLPRDGSPAVARVRFTLDEPGARSLRFRVPLQPDERIEENNARDVLVAVRDGRQKILYFEGEPRFEVRFLRRAVAEDENLQLVVLQRTAEDKYLRFAVDTGEELDGGFPRTREELFAYRALVLGSVEASYFTHDQLRMIEEFVSRRGGGLLMLGGRRSFAEGGWGGTPVADALPVLLGEGARDTTFHARIRVALTREGASHFATQLAADERASAERWRTLPEVTTYNRVSGIKPGATALLMGNGPELAAGQVVLAHQRYGRGHALALPIHDSWLWQMHADIPLEDRTHETFWRQVLRWLVAETPAPVAATLPAEPVRAGMPIPILATVDDATFAPVNHARVVAEITTPTGEIASVPLDWTVGEDGRYAGRYTPHVDGVHDVRVAADWGDEHVSGTGYFAVGESVAEYFDAGMRPALLRRIAQETGGRFYTIDALDTLAEDIGYTGRGVTEIERKDLWDMPAVFLLLIGLLGGEWLFRRWRGLA